MEFKRQWDETCPKVWDRWEKDGVQWWIQDLPPEDDELAVDILVEHLIPDEIMCTTGRLPEDPISTKSMRDVWIQCVKKRMTLACYTYVNGEKALAGCNVLFVKCVGEEENYKVEGKGMHHVMDSLHYIQSRVDDLKYYDVDKILNAMGLVVKREFRGDKLGGKILSARESLCKHMGIKATSSVFTGPAAQKLAMRCGFETLAVVTLKQLAETGLNYPKDETKVMKLMSKRYE